MTDAAGAGRLRFRPTLIASLTAFVAFAVLIGLGVWQLQRLGWKTALSDELAMRRATPAIALPVGIDPQDLEYRRVRLSGRFLPGAELRSAPRNLNKRPGLYVFTPFRLDDGRQIIVNRGWLPKKLEDPGSRGGAAAGPLAFEATLLLEGWRGSDWLRPANDPDKNVWHYVDTAAMAEALELDRAVRGVYAVVLPGALPGKYPVAREPGVDLRNDHLEYAITWFGLAAILAVIFVIYHTRREGSGDPGA